MPTTWAEWKCKTSLLDNQWRWFRDTQLKAATTKLSLFHSPPVITSTTAAASSFSKPSATTVPPAPQPMDLDHTNLVKKDPHSSLCFNCGKPGHIAKVCRGPRAQSIQNVDAATTPRLTPEDLQLLIESIRAVMVSSAVGRIMVPSINCLWSSVWRLSTCLESGIIFNIHFIMQNPSKILLKLKLGNSKVLQIMSKTTYKILLILAIAMVVFPPSYVLWGMRTGTCRVFVYILLCRIPLEHQAVSVSYIVGKAFSRRLRRCWNRENRFSIHREIMETS